VSNDPKCIGPDDLAALTRERELPSERDASPDEAAELSTQRLARVIHIADRYRGALASGDLEASQAASRRSLDRIVRGRTRELATERGVPAERGVLDFAADASPPATAAMLAVRSALAWRAARGLHQPLVLVVLGPVGTGKSCALGWAVAHHDRNARHISAPDALALVDHSAMREARERLVRVDLLALDEAGTEEKPATVLDLVLDRYNAGKVTLFAGNVTREQFAERYTDVRLRSRLARQQADGQRVLVVLDGHDMRQGGAL